MKSRAKFLRLVSRLRNSVEGQSLLTIHRVMDKAVPSYDGEERERLLVENRPSHSQEAPKIGTQVLAGCIIGLLIYAFCNVYASVVFEGPFGKQGVELGVSMNTAGAVVAGLMTTAYASCPVFIAAPEINMAMIHVTVAASISQSVSNPDVALSSTVCAIAFSSLTLGIVFFCLGRFKLTRLVQFIPIVLVHGFLGCIGWEVLMTSMKQAARWEPSIATIGEIKLWATWKRVIPAILMGVPLYMAKRWHWGNQSLVFPAFVLLPVVGFHFVLWWAHVSMDDIREEWMFPAVSRSNFWRQWDIGWHVSAIDLSAVLANFPAFMVMGMIGTVDLLLKLAGSEKAMTGAEVDYDREFMVAGVGNILCFGCMSAPGYVQAKFNLINFALLRSTRERIPGFVSVFILAILFFGGFPLLNIIPRFCLAGILIFVSAAFLTENMIDSARTLAVKEFVAVWVIVVCSAFLGILAAVGVGLVLASFIFAYQYAQRSAIRVQLTGADYRAVARSVEEEAKLQQLGASMVSMLRLQGYIFFGSASQVKEAVKAVVSHVKYVLLDFTSVTGIDSAAVDVFVKIGRITRFAGVVLLWSGLSPRVHYKLHREGVFSTDASIFVSFQEGAEWVETRLLRFSQDVRHRWLVHPLIVYLNCWWSLRRTLKQEWLPLVELEGYAERLTLERNQVFANAGDTLDALYYLLKGRMNVFQGDVRTMCGQRRHQLLPGVFIYPESFVLRTQLPWTLFTAEHCVLLCISSESIRALERSAPQAHTQLQQLVLRQTCREFHQLRMELDATQDMHKQKAVPDATLERLFGERPGVGQKFVSSVKNLARQMSGGSRRMSSSIGGLGRSWAENVKDDPSDSFLPELSEKETAEYTRLFVAATGSPRELLTTHDTTGLHRIAASLKAYQERRFTTEDDEIDLSDPSSFTWPVSLDVCFSLGEFLVVVRRAIYRSLNSHLVQRLQSVFRYASTAHGSSPTSPGGDGLARASSFGYKATGLSFGALKDIMGSSGFPLDDEEVHKLVAEADREATGEVNFDSFVRLFSSGLQREKLNEEAMMVFQLFADSDSMQTSSPVINLGSLLAGMDSLGVCLEHRDAEDMLFEANASHQPYGVTFPDFVDAVLTCTSDFGW
eukprot:TRINITY_DN8371_c0_g1_i1.p1 TRINITY_DN8371_c0_g1~~TRINITY_DN8371_c0_g1_i1.p1  ORF type:complete len:1134 (-),score=152.31 TRINITY_DN8371_c0_g1_i1:36-3407(-)